MSIEKKVINFVIEETGAGSHEVKLTTRLVEDLGIAGDDGYELIMNFNKEFNIRDPLEAKKYFHTEFFSWKELFSRKLPLTINDLILAAKDI